MTPLAAASLFFLKLAVGIMASLLLVPFRGHWKGYFRMMGILSSVLLFVYLLFRGPLGETLSGWPSWLPWFLLAACILHVWASHLDRGAVVVSLQVVAAATGLLSVAWSEAAAAQAFETGVAWDVWALPLLGVLSALFLGLTMAAMLLGHWYLVSPELPIQPLIRLSFGVMVSLVVLLVGAGASALAAWDRLMPPEGMQALDHVVNIGVFVFPRFLVTISALVFAWLTWRCAKIRSTQSATGILYAIVICSLIAELLAAYAYAVTGVPL